MSKLSDELIDAIDRATEPKAMDKQQALDVLEELQTQIEGRIEAPQQEIEDEG